VYLAQHVNLLLFGKGKGQSVKGGDWEMSEEMTDQIYIYNWKNNSKRVELYGRQCRVIARGRANSALVEFENGQREVISRNAIRRVKGK